MKTTTTTKTRIQRAEDALQMIGGIRQELHGHLDEATLLLSDALAEEEGDEQPAGEAADTEQARRLRRLAEVLRRVRYDSQALELELAGVGMGTAARMQQRAGAS